MRKKIVCLLLCMSTLFPMIKSNNIHADEDKSKEKIQKSVRELKAKDFEDLLGQTVDKGSVPKRENSIWYVLQRVLNPGYINDVRDGVFGKEEHIDKSVLVDNKTVCSKAEPQNLLNHNCDVPNAMAEFGQAFLSLFNKSGMENAELTTAKAPYGVGVPLGIPDGKVPVNPNDRATTYTALELFGYDLPLTRYNGEWDFIQVSTEARMLSNFGTVSNLKVAGMSIFNGLKAGATASIWNFSWNPLKWVGNIVSAAAGGAFNTIIDTQELNIIATHAWTRPNFGKTVYNAHYLSDKDILKNANEQFARYFMKEFNKEVNKDPHIKEMLALEHPPVFEFKPNWEKPESKQAREYAMSYNREHPDNPKPVPAPVLYTESEQFAMYKSDNKSFFDRGKAQGINCDSSENYGAMKVCWSKMWKDYSHETLDNWEGRKVLQPLNKKVENRFLSKFPHFNPGRQISHYVCADEDGKPIGESGNYTYVYSKENTRTEEFVNKGCKPVRPSIKGGYFGTGDDTEFTDTRRANFKSSKLLDHIPLFNNFGNNGNNFRLFLAKHLTKLTNELLNFSFYPIMGKIGITDLLEKFTVSFRDSIFFPMVVLLVGISAIWFMAQLLQGKLIDIIKGISLLVLLFMMTVGILYQPKFVSNLVEKYPSKIDNFIANAIINNDEDKSKSICKTDATKEYSSIRSMQCIIWEQNVFTPYVYSQWGTNYLNLNTEAMKNTNTELVGDAKVNFGGGVIKKNWALYQLSKIKSGTITDEDTSREEGTVDKNIYRLVDLQAGPNNAKESDARFFKNWSQTHQPYGWHAFFSALFTFVIIGGFALMKIELTILFTLNLFLLIFYLLAGITPFGRIKLKDYWHKMTGYFFKRCLITMILSFLLKILQIINHYDVSYRNIFIASMAIMGVFYLFRKEFFKLFDMSVDNLKNIKGAIKKSIPKSISYRYNHYKEAFQGYTGGFIGAGLAVAASKANVKVQKGLNLIRKNPKEVYEEHRSILRSAMKQGREVANLNVTRNFRQQRREGFSTYDKMKNAQHNVEQLGKKSFNNPTSKESLTMEALRTQLMKQLGDKEGSYKYNVIAKEIAGGNVKVQNQIRNLSKRFSKNPNEQVMNNFIKNDLNNHIDFDKVKQKEEKILKEQRKDRELEEKVYGKYKKQQEKINAINENICQMERETKQLENQFYENNRKFVEETQSTINEIKNKSNEIKLKAEEMKSNQSQDKTIIVDVQEGNQLVDDENNVLSEEELIDKYNKRVHQKRLNKKKGKSND